MANGAPSDIKQSPRHSSYRPSLPGFLQKKRYTPLVFFKVPKNEIPECDAMEKVIREVEKELGVRVERLDIVRDEYARALLGVLTKSRVPPYLYHRESLQTIHIPRSESRIPTPIDKARVRAWAKGRLLSSSSSSSKAMGTKTKAPTVISQEDNSIDQRDLLTDMTLGPEERRGKEAIQERTEKKARDARK